MKSRSRRNLWPLVALLILATLACNFPGAGSSDADSTPDADATNTPLPFASATPSDDAPAASVVIPTVTPEEEVEGDECTFRAAFVDDVTIPDDTPVDANEAFDKTWRIRNSGTCVWEAGTTLIQVSGDDLSDIDTLAVPATEPDQELELTVAMKAPAAPGTYRSNWQLQTPDSRRYGGVFYAQIVVPDEEEADPDPAPASATAPQDFLGAVAGNCNKVDFSWIDGQGESAYHLAGPGLDINLAADATTYTWNNPPTGTAIVTLTSLDASEDEIASLDTTVSMTCGEGEPDLAVISVTFVPTVPVAHLPVTTTLRIENSGDANSGGFIAQWFAVKTSTSATCTWVVNDGIGEGETKDLTCTTVAYRASYAGMVTQVEVDTTDIISESDEENNILELTTPVIAPEVIYDFVDNAGDAAWIGGPPTTALPWPGDPASDLGYARLTGGTLETGGSIQGLCLETHPRWVAEGIIRGEYEDFGDPDYVIQAGDHFRATISMLQGAEEGAVTHRVMAILSESGGKWILTEPHAYGEGIEVLSADLSAYAGESAAVILQVEAGATSTDDQACWIAAEILRYP